MSPTLRAAEPGDGDALHAIFTEPGVKQFLFDDILLSREQTQAHVEAACTHGAWVICLDGAVVGLASLRPTADDRELVIVIGERCWGKGVAFEAARVALRHGFEVLKLPRILASVDLPNERSHRLMKRLGFAVLGESEGPQHRTRTYAIMRTDLPFATKS